MRKRNHARSPRAIPAMICIGLAHAQYTFRTSRYVYREYRVRVSRGAWHLRNVYAEEETHTYQVPTAFRKSPAPDLFLWGLRPPAILVAAGMCGVPLIF